MRAKELEAVMQEEKNNVTIMKLKCNTNVI